MSSGVVPRSARDRSEGPEREQVIIYVDVRLEDGMDASKYLRTQAESLGARTLSRWNGRESKATHVVWQAGDDLVLREARATGKPVLSPSWVDISVKHGCWQNEHDYLLKDETADACSATRYLRDFQLVSTARGSKRKRGGQSRFETRRNSEGTPLWFTLPPAARWRNSQPSTTQASATQTLLYSAGGTSIASPRSAEKEGPWSYLKRTASAMVGNLAGNPVPRTTTHAPQPSNQAPPQTVIVIDDDEPEIPDSVRHHHRSTISSIPATSSAPPQRRLDPTGAFPMSARDRYWDDDDESPVSKRQTTPAVALDSRLAEVASARSEKPTTSKQLDEEPSHKRRKPASTTGDDQSTHRINEPPRKRRRPTDNDQPVSTQGKEVTDDDDVIILQAADNDDRRTTSCIPMQIEESEKQLQEEKLLPAPSTKNQDHSSERWHTSTTSIIISASGVEASVREAIKQIAKRSGRASATKLRARFIDEQLLTKIRATSVPPKATHLVVPPLAKGRATAPRTLKVLFALARGGTFVVSSDWITASVDKGVWQSAHAYLAGFGPPRPCDTKLFQNIKIHLLTTSLGSTEPPAAALAALLTASGAKSSSLKSATIILVGEHYALPFTATASLKSAARDGRILRVRWFFDAIEHNNPKHPNEDYRIALSR